MERDMIIISGSVLNNRGLTVHPHFDMIPVYDYTKHDKHHYFIIDECDGMMLDQAETFMTRYLEIKDKVGCFFFLTATNFETIENSRSHEQIYIESIPTIELIKTITSKKKEVKPPTIV
jgi:hypothetical protein